MTLQNLLRNPRLPFILALTASLALVGGGLLLAQLLRLAACPLCIIQRMLYLLLALSAAGGLIAAHPSWRRVAAFIMAVIAATGACVAGYQTWIQRFAPETTCGADMPWWERIVDWAGQLAPVLFQPNGLCSDPAWKLLGLSIAEWSLVAFSGLLLLSLYALLRRNS